MKRDLLHLFCCVALLFAGCTQDIDEPIINSPTPSTPSGDLRIDIESNINQVRSTRATDSGFCDGDAVGIYAVNYVDGAPGTLQVEGNQADNVRYMFDFEEYKWIPEYDVYFLDDDTAVDLIGYYPYANPESVTKYPFEVQRKQNTEAGHGLMAGYEASDFLWSKATNVAPTEKRIKMTFYHHMAGVANYIYAFVDYYSKLEYKKTKKRGLTKEAHNYSMLNGAIVGIEQFAVSVATTLVETRIEYIYAHAASQKVLFSIDDNKRKSFFIVFIILQIF